MYYIYEWFVVDTGEIFYVGKGTRERYKCRKRNKLFNEYIQCHECDSRIIKYFESENEAFEYEYNRIKELKEMGQCQCNVMNGGRGGTTEWWTEEARKYYSENNIMKSEEQRERMSRNNPMKNKEVAMKVNSQKRKAVIIDDKEFVSVKEAVAAYNICPEVLATWCKKGINPYGEKCRYKGMPQAEYSAKRYNPGGSRPVIYQGVRYECALDFANAIGISQHAATQWLKRGFNSDGVPCRYEDDTRELTFVNRYTVRNQNRAKPVIVNGIEYKSCTHASEALGIPRSTLYSYLNRSKHNEKYICEYGNQQPSQGNVN